MVRRLFSVLFAAGIAVACSSATDGARTDTGGGGTAPFGTSGNGVVNGGGTNGVVGMGGAQTTGGGAVVTGGSGIVSNGGASVVGNGGAVAAAGSAGSTTGPLCGGPAIPSDKGRCNTGVVVAKGSALTIDDFEDPGVDNDYMAVFFGDGRSGKWFDSHDLTHMPVVTMTPEATTGGAPGNTRAMHYKGTAPMGWGATLGITVANCYDASAYKGLSFWIKGSPAAGNSQVKFSLHSPISEPAPSGGCSAADNTAGKCYDHFAKVITLTDQWTHVTAHWKELTQNCASDPAYVPQSQILTLSYSILDPNSGFDFWVDDLSFDTGDLPMNGFSDLVPKAMFEEMWQTTMGTTTVNQRNPFYTYEGMVSAISKWPNFCTTGTADDRRREAAAFLSNVGHETDSLALIEEKGCEGDHTCTQYGQAPSGVTYHGRGPIQLSYAVNYTNAGTALGLGLANDPEMVAKDPAVSFGTALWFWNTYQSGKGVPHDAIKTGGLGATINIINGIECGGANAAAVANRIKLYKRFCEMLGVDPGPNQGC